MLKRARSTAATGRATSINASVQSDLGIPEIPKINGELILQVFTHRSLRRASCPPEQYDDNERLSELGAKALEACVTHALFDRRPMLDSSEIVVSKLQRIRRTEILSDETIEKWALTYSMSTKVRCHPDVLPLLATVEEARSIFTSYVAGVMVDSGMDVLQEWIDKLVDTVLLLSQPPTAPPLQHANASPPSKRIRNDGSTTEPPIFFGSQPPSSPPKHDLLPRAPSLAPRSQFPNPLAPAQPHLPFLPLFNQTAAQRRVTVEYPADSSGPAHALRWTVQCVVNGILKGVGTGTSKQIAKEEAARQGYSNYHQ